MRRVSFVLALVIASSAGFALAQASSVEVQGSRPECVAVLAEARMQAFGWDHYVRLRNGCAQPMTCRVSTNVNPTPQSLPLAVGETRETLMWRGSPASTFVANVECAAR
ncbi:hypothetical protein [Sandaracinus amylolyticus]|uniref:Secreted protein n=1 Tax=Sandaracinus amylolyticus TaxID=927083 RepID=A0A0F6W680_9BACT|nr:hypothetical protein [Sandaracinus amylolyticus]AKF08327.1 hypothetical protein DB32_005476 [Sandaracinus amylolyticus]